MKTFKRTTLSTTLVLSLVVSVLATTQFSRTFTLTGGSAQRLSTVVAAQGYTGKMTVSELTICNPATTSANLYEGQSDVDATNGDSYIPSRCYTQRGADSSDPIDLTQIYLFVASDQSVTVKIRSK